jgi:hypothetical protein
MNITITENLSANISLSPEEAQSFIDKCHKPWHERSMNYFSAIGEKMAVLMSERKALPIFILAGNERQARDYARKYKLHKYDYVDNPRRLLGYLEFELHYVGTWIKRRDLMDVSSVLIGRNVKAVYGN